MTDIGYFALQLGLMVSVGSIILVFLGVKQKRPELIRSGENGVVAVLGLTTIAVFALEYLMITSDFNVEYVAKYTSRALPLIYKIAALWGGQAGSLLFWLFLLAIYSAVAVLVYRKKHRKLMPWVVGTTMVTSLFFHLLLVFVANPFARLDFIPIDGNGLNPLLQNPYMAIHPIMLYLGYVGFVIPFAFAIGALATKHMGTDWLRAIRRSTMTAWLFLTIGNILGMKWAYVELGWGGFWAWDPVENAAILPWFTGTAFLHSVMIQEKKGMLKIWNMVLIITTFLLTIFGTFLTRSGILSSVHTFTKSAIGPMFFGFLALMAVASFGLLFMRLDSLKSESQLESFISRESTFLFNNLLLVGAAFAVLWGTIFPLVSESFKGVQVTVSAPFFNAITVPIGLSLILLTGVCTMISWRKMTLSKFRKNFLYPLVFSVVLIIVQLAVGLRGFYTIMAFTFLFFTVYSLFMEFWMGTRARQRMTGEKALQALNTLVGKNKRRYGGYIVHFGMVLIFFGFAGSGSFQFEKQIYMKEGESVQMRDYMLIYRGLASDETDGYTSVYTNLDIYKNGKLVSQLKPEKRFYPKQEQPNTEVVIYSTFKEDFYVILAGWDDEGATIKVYINPLIIWIWLGGIVVVLGTLVAIAPDDTFGRLRRRRKMELEETA
ncbi:heme lyase CcmF/NrfE family subunit [Candidatus Marinimicrobia bacterium MT.SAG.4]|nr:heme lyase CcmF/NrfE family subunit [Candidatus Marinimicrobia bacterium MT.SAG.4]